jgi:hypothetical protein
MNRKRRIVIVGATSAIAEQCARIWVKESDCDVVLVGRTLEKLDIIATDLRVRSPNTSVITIETDFLDSEKIKSLADQISGEKDADIVLIAHGSLPSQQNCQNNLHACQSALEINAISPVLFSEAFVSHMEKAGKGTLAIIGSVAGDRGRKSNYVYGAAKGLVARYAQGLQHRLAHSAVKVVLIKPGPTDTPMTAHLKASGVRLADAGCVATLIVRAIKSGKPVVYAPRKWGLIMYIIIHMPWIIFKKMDV